MHAIILLEFVKDPFHVFLKNLLLFLITICEHLTIIAEMCKRFSLSWQMMLATCVQLVWPPTTLQLCKPYVRDKHAGLSDKPRAAATCLVFKHFEKLAQSYLHLMLFCVLPDHRDNCILAAKRMGVREMASNYCARDESWITRALLSAVHT